MSKRVLVTGPNSMIGQAVVKELQKANYKIIPLDRKSCDLLNTEKTINKIVDFSPDVLIHLAGYNGNIQFNLKNPTDIFFNTSMMALNVLRGAEIAKTDRVITTISSCAYPDLQGDISEYQLWDGLPNHSVDCHGLSKRVLDAYGMQLLKTGVKYTSCVLNNSFGPGDSLDLEKTKVVSAMIVKFLKAKHENLPSVTMWGNGQVKREFLYSKDAAKGIVQLIDKPILIRVNISSGFEITIRELANALKDLTGYKGEILWDESKPNGQNQKKLDTACSRQFLNIQYTSMLEALEETIKWTSQKLAL